MGWMFAGVPPYMVEWGARVLPPGTPAIETGTFRGDSTAVLARSFARCTTIERSEAIAEQARARFAGYADVSILVGSSRQLLAGVLTDCNLPPFAWLDAHWSGGSTVGKDDPCPVVAEIDALGRSFGGQAIVLADDARIFGCASPSDPVNNEWPSLLDVLSHLAGYGWSTFVLDDVVAGVPRELAGSFAGLNSCSRTSKWSRLAAQSRGVRNATTRLPMRWRKLSAGRHSGG